MHSGGGPPQGHGAPLGNDNAEGNAGGGAPPRNTNAQKYGAWNDPLKEYDRLEGDEKGFADQLVADFVERSKADLEPADLERKARRLAVLMVQSSRGWVHAIGEDALTVERERTEGDVTIVGSETNPAIKADFRNASKERKLYRELRLFPSPDGRPWTEHG